MSSIKNEEEQKQQSLHDCMQQFQNELLENNKKTQEMIEEKIRRSSETKKKHPETPRSETPKPISLKTTVAKPQECQSEVEVAPKKQAQKPLSFAAAPT